MKPSLLINKIVSDGKRTYFILIEPYSTQSIVGICTPLKVFNIQELSTNIMSRFSYHSTRKQNENINQEIEFNKQKPKKRQAHYLNKRWYKFVDNEFNKDTINPQIIDKYYSTTHLGACSKEVL